MIGKINTLIWLLKKKKLKFKIHFIKIRNQRSKRCVVMKVKLISLKNCLTIHFRIKNNSEKSILIQKEITSTRKAKMISFIKKFNYIKMTIKIYNKQSIIKIETIKFCVNLQQEHNPNSWNCKSQSTNCKNMKGDYYYQTMI